MPEYKGRNTSKEQNALFRNLWTEYDVHSAAGNKLGQTKVNGTHVILVHEGEEGSGIGCGALGSLNPRKADESIGHMWHGLKELGIKPEKYFGMEKEKLTGIAEKLKLSDNAHEHAKRILKEYKNAGKAAIVGVFAHENGTIEHKGSANLKKAGKEEKVILNVCSDARVPEEAAKKYFEEVMRNKLKAGEKISVKDLVAPNPKVQAPEKILVHEPYELPGKGGGKIFTVTRHGVANIDELLSIAYALTHFGPKTGVNSLKKIEVTQSEAHEELKKRLLGLKGIELVLRKRS